MIITNQIRSAVENYREIFGEGENEQLDILLSGSNDPTSRKNMRGHVTCSGLVLAEGGLVLMIHHGILRKWLLPGGHIEADDSGLEDAALREVFEETGMDRAKISRPYWMPENTPIDIDTHPIPRNASKDEGDHYHHDLRFVFQSKKVSLTHQQEEVSAAEWKPISSLSEHIQRRIIKLSGGVT